MLSTYWTRFGQLLNMLWAFLDMFCAPWTCPRHLRHPGQVMGLLWIFLALPGPSPGLYGPFQAFPELASFLILARFHLKMAIIYSFLFETPDQTYKNSNLPFSKHFDLSCKMNHNVLFNFLDRQIDVSLVRITLCRPYTAHYTHPRPQEMKSRKAVKESLSKKVSQKLRRE